MKEKGFTLKYDPAKEVIGRDVACNAEASAHLHARKLVINRAAPMCAGQHAVKLVSKESRV
jgi:hypothetical protein